MRPVVRADFVLVAFLVVGGVAAWYVLWRVTQNNCVMATDGNEDFYRIRAMYLGIALGAIAGCWFGSIAAKGQWLHALLFSVAAAGIGFALLGGTRNVMYPLDRYEMFIEWTDEHNITWLDTVVFWTRYWIEEAIYDWLLPQLSAQIVAIGLTLWVKGRYRTYRTNALNE